MRKLKEKQRKRKLPEKKVIIISSFISDSGSNRVAVNVILKSESYNFTFHIGRFKL